MSEADESRRGPLARSRAKDHASRHDPFAKAFAYHALARGCAPLTHLPPEMLENMASFPRHNLPFSDTAPPGAPRSTAPGLRLDRQERRGRGRTRTYRGRTRCHRRGLLLVHAGRADDVLGAVAVDEDDVELGDEQHVTLVLGENPIPVAVIGVGVGREPCPLRTGRGSAAQQGGEIDQPASLRRGILPRRPA